jgi:hypothetical protein
MPGIGAPGIGGAEGGIIAACGIIGGCIAAPCGIGGMTWVCVGCKFCGGSVGQPPLDRSNSS